MKTRTANWDYTRMPEPPPPFDATCPKCGAACYKYPLPDGVTGYSCPNCKTFEVTEQIDVEAAAMTLRALEAQEEADRQEIISFARGY